MRNIAIYLVLSVLCVNSGYSQAATPVKSVQPTVIEEDELFFEDEFDLEEEELEDFEEI